MRRVWRATVYLLGCLPASLYPPRSAARHLRRASAVLGANLHVTAGQPPPTARRGRYLGWVAAHAGIGVPAGLLVLFCLLNALVAVVVAPLWWAFPSHDPLRLLLEAPVTSWGAAAALGAAQLAILAGVAVTAFPPLAIAHARVTRALLAPSPAERLADRVDVLTRTRAGVLDAHDAELRRIERDLHDGTQARLVAIAMRLAVARQALPDAPPAVADLLRQAHEGTEEAMTELRAVLRTMYPPILSDLGLAGALRSVAARGGMPVDVDVGDLGPVPAAVEAVAYFAVTEALTNVAKHSRATRATVRVCRDGDLLHVTVHDDGIGGASPDRGTGLDGIRRRAEALDGRLTVASPSGGPTTLHVELPCGS